MSNEVRNRILKASPHARIRCQIGINEIDEHIFDRTISPTAYWALSLLRKARRGVRFNEQ